MRWSKKPLEFRNDSDDSYDWRSRMWPRNGDYLLGLICFAVLALCAAYFANSYGFYFLITWLPSYLEKQRGYQAGEFGQCNTLSVDRRQL